MAVCAVAAPQRARAHKRFVKCRTVLFIAENMPVHKGFGECGLGWFLLTVQRSVPPKRHPASVERRRSDGVEARIDPSETNSLDRRAPVRPVKIRSQISNTNRRIYYDHTKQFRSLAGHA